MKALLRVAQQLARAPGFTVPVVAGLGVAIGASTAVFSVFSAMLIRSQGVADERRVAAVWRADEAHGQQSVEISYADYVAWNKARPALDGLALASSVNLDLTVFIGKTPERIESTTVTGNYFRVLGAKPFAGRLLEDDDDRPGAPPRGVLSYRFWRTRFGGDFGMIGRRLRSPDGQIEVVGIARPEFDLPRDVAIWLPLRAVWPSVEGSADLRVFRGIARLGRQSNVEQARAVLDSMARRAPGFGQTPSGAPSVLVRPLVDEIYGIARPAIWILLAAVLLVIVIACANAANLFLNRAVERGHELALRTALGASRGRVIRLLLGESAMLAAASGALGLALAAASIRILTAVAPAGVPRIADAQLDHPVLGFGLCVTAATVLLFGVGPAVLACRRDPIDALKEGRRSASGSIQHARYRRLLIAVEAGLSTLLLIAAGALTESFARMTAVDPGFRSDRILTFRVTLDNADQARRRAFYSEALARVRSLPGVESAAAVLLRPLSGPVGWDTTYVIEGQPPDRPNTNPNGNYQAISAGYFRTMGIRMLAGRDFTAADTVNAPGVVILDEVTARRHWRSGDAVGRRLRLSSNPKDPWLTVVGVVGSVRYREWQAPWPDFYVPFTQRAQHRSDFVVKTAGDPWTLAEAVRREILAIDGNQPISNLTTMEELVDRVISGSRFNSVVMASLAGCALLLAGFGIYAVLSYVITQRRSEIAIRVALGATPGRIVGLVGADTLGAVVSGVGGGLAAAVGLQKALGAMLSGVAAGTPAAYCFAVILLAAIAVLAGVAPALRAAVLDPAAALKST